MNYEVYHIPTNFTDAGRVMGLFELRNLVEAVVLTIPVLYLCIAFLPFALSTKIMVTLVVIVSFPFSWAAHSEAAAALRSP